MIPFLSQYLSFWITIFYLILEFLRNFRLIKQTNTIYLSIYSLMFMVVTVGSLLIAINGEKIRKNVDSPFKPNQMLSLHLVLLVYVVLNNPFLKIDINNNLLSRIIIIDSLVLVGYFIFTKFMRINTMNIYGIN